MSRTIFKNHVPGLELYSGVSERIPEPPDKNIQISRITSIPQFDYRRPPFLAIKD